MEFQQCTTPDQARELKALGLQQFDEELGPMPGWHYQVLMAGEGNAAVWKLCDDMDVPLTPRGDVFRALSLQEMLHELFSSYSVELTAEKRAHSIPGVCNLLIEREDIGVHRFDGPEGDPFPAVYAAYVWHLKCQREASGRPEE